MRKILVFLLTAIFATSAAFAHEGKSHKLLGTVKVLHENHLVVTTPDGREKTVQLTQTTRYEKDKKAVTRAALVAGARVSVNLSEDDKTAVKVTIGTAAAQAAAAQVVDPVCGMKVDNPKTAPTSVHAGKTYWFCSKEDKAKFDKNPESYLKKG